ncbi:MAG TPA: hypothetical protein VN380_14025 [Thermoanaerobaculia bacterium]|jgi:hypothetical protein|nr:hypothetical protein [Thermoanaerobaculia bacterium]
MDEEPRFAAFETENGIPRLQQSVVAFVDFLGFSRQIREAAKHSRVEELLRNVHEFLSSWRPALIDRYSRHPDRRKDWEIKFFTDNIVIGRPLRPERGFEMGSVIGSLCLFQLDAISHGFFLRGGISVGSFFMDDHVVFGVPLLDAYETESCIAKSPRIVLAASARELVAASILSRDHAECSPYYHDVIQENDGEWFLNYLEACFHNYTEPPEFAWIKAHRDEIIRCIARHQSDPKIFPKYEWAARYHNFWCVSWHIPQYRIEGFEPLQVKRLSEADIAP